MDGAAPQGHPQSSAQGPIEALVVAATLELGAARMRRHTHASQNCPGCSHAVVGRTGTPGRAPSMPRMPKQVRCPTSSVDATLHVWGSRLGSVTAGSGVVVRPPVSTGVRRARITQSTHRPYGAWRRPQQASHLRCGRDSRPPREEVGGPHLAAGERLRLRPGLQHRSSNSSALMLGCTLQALGLPGSVAGFFPPFRRSNRNRIPTGTPRRLPTSGAAGGQSGNRLKRSQPRVCSDCLA